MENILVIDDDEKILELVQEVLKNEHYIVETRSYVDNTNIGEFEGFDLILLDIMLPFLDGYEILERIKNIITCPVIFLSAKSSEGAKVKGLMSGADDYITKPFSVNELLARISAHLRREQRSHNKTKSKFSEDLIIDYSDRSLYIKGHKIELSNKEFEIIQLLSSNAGQVFDREKIYENIWGIAGNGDSVVIKEHIRKIRLKFNEFTDKGYITTVWGVGYKWEK